MAHKQKPAPKRPAPKDRTRWTWDSIWVNTLNKTALKPEFAKHVAKEGRVELAVTNKPDITASFAYAKDNKQGSEGRITETWKAKRGAAIVGEVTTAKVAEYGKSGIRMWSI